MSTFDPRCLIGLPYASNEVQSYLRALSDTAHFEQMPSREVKVYPDALYMNYYKLGLSLLFVEKDGKRTITTADVDSGRLILDSIDIYNSDSHSSADAMKTESSTPAYLTHPVRAFELRLVQPKDASKPRPPQLHVVPESTGKDLVGVLGEPDRKGGGAGPMSGSIGIWCEWSRDGIMVEFGGINARGPHAWEMGKDAKWRVLTLFQPKEE